MNNRLKNNLKYLSHKNGRNFGEVLNSLGVYPSYFSSSNSIRLDVVYKASKVFGETMEDLIEINIPLRDYENSDLWVREKRR